MTRGVKFGYLDSAPMYKVLEDNLDFSTGVSSIFLIMRYCDRKYLIWHRLLKAAHHD
jgi:hypothetical protein